MKAVIVECSNGAAVALCDDGSFRKLKNKGYSIGQELMIKHKPSSNRMVQKLSICASLALVLLSFAGIGSHSYVKPYSYVSLDINPSIEYALNRYDKVISVSGINNEGQQVVSSIESDIKNQNITTALGVTIGQLEKDHYIVQEAYNHVIVSVYSANDTKAQSIASRVNSFSAQQSDICSIDTIPVSKEVKDDADSLGITPGKLALIHAVAESTSDSDFNVSDWANKTVSELETTIQQANSSVPDSGISPASANVVTSEYLSSVLDDTTDSKPDNAAVSDVDTEHEAGSASADNQTAAAGSGAASPGAGDSVSASKPDNTGSVTPSSDSSADSPGKPGTSSSTNNSSSADTNSIPNQDTSANASDKNQSPDKGDSSADSPSKNPETSDSGSSPSKGDSASEPGSNTNTDDTLTEDSSIKNDSYPVSDTNAPDNVSDENTSSGQNTADDNTSEEDTPDQAASSGTVSDDSITGNDSFQEEPAYKPVSDALPPENGSSGDSPLKEEGTSGSPEPAEN